MTPEMQKLQVQFIMQGCKEAALRFAAEDQGVADLVSRIRPVGQMGTVDFALVELVKHEVKTMGHGLFFEKAGVRDRLLTPKSGYSSPNVCWVENRFDWTPTNKETAELIEKVRADIRK